MYKFDPELDARIFQRHLETVYTNENGIGKSHSDGLFLLCEMYVVAESMLDLRTRNATSSYAPSTQFAQRFKQAT